MKRLMSYFMVLLVIGLPLGCSNKDNEALDGIQLKANTFIQLLADEEFDEATSYFDNTMASEVTPEDLKEIWEMLHEQLGDFINHSYTNTMESLDGYQIVLIRGIFKAEDVVFRITFNDNEEIAGFFL